MTGRIVTFYSPRGELGRGMALANLAWLLAEGGSRVLIVDWDAESSTVLSCFDRSFGPDRRAQVYDDVRSGPDLMDLVELFNEAAARSPEEQLQSLTSARQVSSSIVTLAKDFDSVGRIELLPAGTRDRSDNTNSGRLADSDRITTSLDVLWKEIGRRYDYVLVNCPAGSSDAIRASTAIPPDVLVVCFSTARTSIEGARAAAVRIDGQLKSDPRLRGRLVRVLPTLFKVDPTDNTRLTQAREEVRAAFSEITMQSGLDGEVVAVEIPEVPAALADTILPAEPDLPSDHQDLGRAYRRVAEIIVETGQRPMRAGGLGGRNDAQLVVCYAAGDQGWAEWIRQRLTHRGVSSRLRAIDLDGTLGDALPAVALAERLLVLYSVHFDRSPLAASLLLHATRGQTSPTVVVLLDTARPSGGVVGARTVVLDRLPATEAAEALFSALGLTSAVSQAVGATREVVRFPREVAGHRRLPLRNEEFMGRGEILDRLRRQFVHGERVTQLLIGIAGVGKTSVALEFAHRFAFDYDIVWWVDAAGRDVLHGDLFELAASLNVQSGAADGVERLHTELRASRGTLRWLLIFDAADDPDDLTGLLPDGIGHVLITTRNTHWDQIAMDWPTEIVLVDVFRPTEAAAYLRNRLPAISEVEASSLAEQLGNLPLAMSQAGSSLATSQESVGDYLHRASQLKDPTSAAWLLALEQLRATMPAAAKALEILAFLAPEPIPSSVYFGEALVATLGDRTLRDSLRRRRLPTLIAQHGLAQLDAVAHTIKMHRLVQAVIREQQAPDDAAEHQRIAFEALALANPAPTTPGGPDNRDTHPAYHMLWPHLASPGFAEHHSDAAHELVLDLIRYRYRLGDYAGSEELAGQTLKAWSEVPGPDDLVVLRAGIHRAKALRHMGQLERARQLDQEILDKLTVTVGDDDPYALTVASGLASDLRALGYYREALTLDEDTALRAGATMGRDEPQALEFASNLATSHRMLGHAELAAEISLDTFNRRLRVLGEDHLYTAFAANGYGRDLRDLGRFEESRDWLERAHQMYIDVVGREHPDTLRAAKNLAVTYRRLGSFEAAHELASQTHLQSIRQLGEDHPESLICLLTVATTYSVLNRHDVARHAARQVVEGMTERLGRDHIYTLIARHNLAAIELKHQPPIVSVDVVRGITDELKSGLGEEHWITYITALNLANHLSSAGEFHEARVLDEVTYDRLCQRFGEAHPDAIAAGINLAIGLQACHEVRKAEKFMDNVQARAVAGLPADHPRVIAAQRWERWTFTFVDPPPLA